MASSDSKDRIYIYIYENLCMGGIQNHIFKMCKYLNSEGCPICIVRNKKFPIEKAYQNVIEQYELPVIDTQSMTGYEENLLNYASKLDVDSITFVTFTIPDYAYIKKVQRKFSQYRVDTYYYVPNFTGRFYYLEETFSGLVNKSVRKRMSDIFCKMDANDEIRYFAESHQEVVPRLYGVNLDGRIMATRVPPVPSKQDVFDELKRREIYKRKEFRLITSSRFDFPHKGFIIGLIKEYGKLKKKYPQLTYAIIGYYDAGLAEIHRTIETLDQEAKRDIHILDRMSPEDLAAQYADANMNISVAGCCSLGARVGVPSPPTRHFTYDCEVYGFYHTHKHMNTNSEPGLPVTPFIEKVLNMSEDEYVELCRSEFEAYHEVWSTSSIFDHNNTQENVLSEADIKYIFRVCKWIDRIHPIKSYWHAIKEKGLFTLVKRRLKKIFK